MNPRVKMMIMSSDKKSDGRYRDYARDYYDDDLDNRFRDRRGREHYDDGRYAPQSNMRVENRRDSMGRYARSRYDDAMGNYDVRNDHRPYVEPVYRDTTPKMHKIGFSVDGEMERLPSELKHDYRTSADYKDMDDEVSHRKGGEKMIGHGSSSEVPHMTREMAMDWVENMKNEDGTTGPHWSMEQIKQVMAQKGIECDPIEFFVALNATHSDLSREFKKYGINNIDAYVDFAKAFWLHDKDAQPDKLARYYMDIVKH